MDELREKLSDCRCLSAQSKIELWLCYKNLKLVSAFPLLDEYKNSLEDQENLNQWTKDAGLQIKKNAESSLYIVSKDKKLIDQLIPILFSNERKDIETKGKLYGYPTETALAVYRNFTNAKDGLPKGVGIKKDNNFGITWWPYVRYVVREGFEYEDSLIAKRWSEVIKKDLPEVDKEFEKLLINLL